MPELTTLTIPATGLREGDLLVDFCGGEITTPPRRTREYMHVMHVTTSGDSRSKLRFRLDETVNIRRLEPTQDELAAAKVKVAETLARDFIQSLGDSSQTNPLTHFIDRARELTPFSIKLAVEWHLAEALFLEARLGAKRFVEQWTERQADEPTYLAAARALHEHMSERVLTDTANGVDRSTDDLFNAIQRVCLRAQADLVRDLGLLIQTYETTGSHSPARL